MNKKAIIIVLVVLILVAGSIGVCWKKSFVYYKQRGTKNKSIVYNKNGRNILNYLMNFYPGVLDEEAKSR